MAIEFDNETKPFSREVPFARIRSPLFRASVRADGLGHDCGCRGPDDYDPSVVAAALVGGVLDAAGEALEIPERLETVANRVLKEQTGTNIDELKEELAKWVATKVEGIFFAGGLRMVPSWVPVNRRIVPDPSDPTRKKKMFDPAFTEVNQEVQGELTRSFQSVLDPPVLPWSRFYGWNFHVRVDPKGGFEHVIGPGNVLNKDERDDLGGDLGTGNMVPAFDMEPNAESTTATSFECVWDTGAFSQTPGNTGNMNFRAGVMFHEKWPFWPMAGDRFWAEGRWVYDCTHPSTRVRKPDGTETVRHWTQMNPCRAVATYRLEGVKFEEEEKIIPAARFLFFASVKGGYKDGPKFTTRSADADPVFLVDLPPAPVPEKISWAIGHSPTFETNTVVLRPRLRIKKEFAPFGIPTTDFARDLFSFGKAEPKIELVRSRKDAKLPDQLKITLPLSQVSEDCYGVVISAGWADPTGEQAARTKKVTVRFDRMTDVKVLEAPFIQFNRQDIVRIKVCANGHWAFSPAQVLRESVGLGLELPPFFLPDDADLVLSAHGTERRGRGEFMETNTDQQRQLNVGGIFDFGSDELEQKLAQGEKTIKIATETGETLTMDIKELKILQESLGVAKELLKRRRPVVWDNDVDQVKEPSIASAVARETYMKPVAAFNKRNAPLGLADHVVTLLEGVYSPHTKLARGATQSTVPDPDYQGHKMSDLLATHKPGAKTTHVFKLAIPLTRVVGDSHMLGSVLPQLLEIPPDDRHYTVQVTVTIEDQ